MQIVCAWCGLEISDDKSTDRRTSHGMCKDCEKIQNRILDEIENHRKVKGGS